MYEQHENLRKHGEAYFTIAFTQARKRRQIELLSEMVRVMVKGVKAEAGTSYFLRGSFFELKDKKQYLKEEMQQVCDLYVKRKDERYHFDEEGALKLDSSNNLTLNAVEQPVVTRKHGPKPLAVHS